MARVPAKFPAALAAAAVAGTALRAQAMRFGRRADSPDDGVEDLVEVAIQHHIDRSLASRGAVGLALVDVEMLSSPGGSIDAVAWATNVIEERRPRPLLVSSLGPHVLLLRGGRDEADVASSLMFDVEALRDVAVRQPALRVNNAGISGAPRDGTRCGQLVHAAAASMYEGGGLPVGQASLISVESAQHDAGAFQSSSAALGISICDLDVAFQPKVSFSDLTLMGAEALIRWPQHAPNPMSASAIVARCQAHGQMRELTDHVLDRCGQMGAQFMGNGDTPITLSVNMSAEDLSDPELSARIDKALAPHGMSPDTLVVEITENSLLPAEIEQVNTLPRLRELGVELSIDDFGTGYSSLSHLRRFSVQELKIDMFFVDRMAYQPKDAVIVRGIVDMAHGLGLRVVAEGVESTESWRMLEGYEVDLAQGHNVARAMLPDDFIAWRQAWALTHQDRVRSAWETPELPAGDVRPEPG